MINKTIIQGRFVETPELKQTQSGIAVCSFRVAWSKKYKETEYKCFLNCVAWRHTAEFVCKYFGKGQECVVEGELRTRTYQNKDGDNRSIMELDDISVHFCGSKSDNTATTAAPSPHTPGAAAQFEDYPDDGDLPF